MTLGVKDYEEEAEECPCWQVLMPPPTIYLHKCMNSGEMDFVAGVEYSLDVSAQ